MARSRRAGAVPHLPDSGSWRPRPLCQVRIQSTPPEKDGVIVFRLPRFRTELRWTLLHFARTVESYLFNNSFTGRYIDVVNSNRFCMWFNLITIKMQRLNPTIRGVTRYNRIIVYLSACYVCVHIFLISYFFCSYSEFFSVHCSEINFLLKLNKDLKGLN